MLSATVREAQARVDSVEFSELWAEYSLEPWGERRGDVQMGILASSLVAAQTGKSFPPSDFIPDFAREPEGPEDMAEKVRRAFGIIVTEQK